MKKNNIVIYIGLRLFNYNDKIQAELLEKEILKIENVKTFMPFRDTDEHNINSQDKCKIIYNEDIQRLNNKRVNLVVALFDGICKDEGIAFEIGYSFGRKIPVLLVNTDFIWYSNNRGEFLFDPVIQYMINDFVHNFKIKDESDFYTALIKSQQDTFGLVAKRINEILKTPCKNRIPFFKQKKNKVGKSVFIDFGGLKYEYQRILLKEILNNFDNKGIVSYSERYSYDNKMEHIERGRKDILNLLEANIFIFCGDEIEINSGTAALLGLAKSIGIKSIMYESSNIEIRGENNHKMKKNLMIDYSVDIVVKSIDNLINMLEDINNDGI